MKKYILLLFLSFIFSNAYSQDSAMEEAQTIIDKAIEAHGGKSYDKLNFSFVFRKKEYNIRIDNGNYEYIRSFTDEKGSFKDVLNNDGFKREHNGNPVVLSEKDSKKYSNSVNSVAYFTLLPKGLNDPAVRKKLIGKTTIKDNEYFHIEVKFIEDGGGEDHEDVFGYWINSKTFTVDYIAYSYHVNGGGVRFRQAIEAEKIGGIRFQNYINFKPASKETLLKDLPLLFEKGELKKLSEIKNEKIKILAL